MRGRDGFLNEVENLLAEHGVGHGALEEISSPHFSRLLTDHQQVFIKCSRHEAYGYPDKSIRGLLAASHLWEHGVNVLRPLLMCHSWIDGLCVSVWPHVKLAQVSDGDWPDVIRMFADVHSVPAPCDWGALFHPEVGVRELVERLPRQMPHTLREDKYQFDKISDGLIERLGQGQQVLSHGDAHVENMGLVGGSLMWFDFENAVVCSPEWDLSRLPLSLAARKGRKWPIGHMLRRYEEQSESVLDIDLLRDVTLFRSLGSTLYWQSALPTNQRCPDFVKSNEAVRRLIETGALLGKAWWAESKIPDVAAQYV